MSPPCDKSLLEQRGTRAAAAGSASGGGSGCSLSRLLWPLRAAAFRDSYCSSSSDQSLPEQLVPLGVPRDPRLYVVKQLPALIRFVGYSPVRALYG